MLHSTCHQFWPISLCFCGSSPKHQKSTFVIHIRNGVLFIIGLVDPFTIGSWPKNFGLITPNNFQKFWGLFLCCLTWLSSGDSSSASLLCILKQPHHFFQRALYVSWSYLWVFLCIPNNFPGNCSKNVCWSTCLVSTEFEHCWLAFSVPWISFYILLLLYKVQLPSTADPYNIFFPPPWLGVQQGQHNAGWNMQGSVRSPETHWLQVNRSQLALVAIKTCVSTVCILLIQVIRISIPLLSHNGEICLPQQLKDRILQRTITAKNKQYN